MLQSIDANMFDEAFRRMDRENFSYQGKKSLFYFLEEWEDANEEEIELDVVRICCEYTEFDNVESAFSYYNEITDKDPEEMTEWLQDRTSVIFVDGGGIILQNF